MSLPSEETVALRLAVLLHRSGKARGRVSDSTYRILSERQTLRESFMTRVAQWLEEFGIIIVRISRGGHALIAISALEGAPPISVKEHFPAAQRKNLTNDDLYSELGLNQEDEDEDDDNDA